MRRNLRSSAVSLLLTALMIASALTFMPINVGNAAPRTMTFTSGDTVNFGSTVNMEFSSGIIMKFGTNISMQVLDMNGGLLAPCDWLQIVKPVGYIPPPCSWWEVLLQGQPTGIEFHIDQTGPTEFHIDMMRPGPAPIPAGLFWAVMKVDVVAPCRYYTVHWPAHWYPAPCSWWEILDSETREPTGFEFHVDWTNESCEFHIDEVTPGPYILQFPVYEIIARKKVTEIKTCDWFHVETPQGFVPNPCTWWEVTIPQVGSPTGIEFHVDTYYSNGTFHIDEVLPQSPAPIPWGPTDLVPARKKVDTIQQCSEFQSFDLARTPNPCSWWKVVHPDVGDVEFHVDNYDPNDGTFHVDYADPVVTFYPPTFEVVAEKKIYGISPCDWFKVTDPTSWVPAPCTHWKIIWPTQWAGVKFHVDSSDGIDRFHVDSVDQMGPGPMPPPWNVTAEQYTPTEPWYIKPPQDDYAPSGMPDFDQHQDQWGPGQGIYTWCGPVATANSLWWLDSEYETLNFPTPVPPPAISDHFRLVTSYNPGVWDDHDPQNVDPLVRNLAFLMDTDGQRTGLPHQGTNYIDMETGISQYLQQQGVNPLGDCDGDGKVEPDDTTIVTLAMGSAPGMPNWNMAADVIIDNLVNMADALAVASHMGQTGMFYEHTEEFADFYWIEAEIERCQDVELFLEFWQFTGSSWVKLYDNPSLEAGHFVTCAGVNSTNRELLISDPYWDAFEAGATQGRSPAAHLYPHPPLVHNDAQYVSHDEYIALPWIVPPPSPYGSKPIWELAGYLQALGYDQTWHAFIRAAVATSPLGEHDVAVVDVWNSKQGCTPKPTVGRAYPVHINVTVENQGDFVETFNLTVYATSMPPSAIVGTQLVANLLVGEIRVLHFVWNTAGLSYGDYSISATATPVPLETDTTDNTFADGTVTVTIPGDVDGNYIVNIFDVVKITGCYGKKRGDPQYNPNSDLDDNNVVNIFDVVICTGNYGKKYP